VKRNPIRGLLLALVVVAGLGCVWQLQKRIDGIQKATATQADNLTIRSGRLLKYMSLEYSPLVAAMYWTRAVQYYGEKHRLHDSNLELLWPLLDVTTTIDPHLLPAYRFGAIFLGQKKPAGAGEPERAIELLQRGIRENPGEWRLYQDLGNLYYLDLRDYAKASTAFAEGSKNPQSYVWMKIMAAKIAAEGESPETSYFLWQQIYETSKDPAIKKNAEEHLILLTATLDMKAIDQAAEQFERQSGRRAARIGELVEAGFLRSVPKDPEGYPYVLGESGKAELNLKSPLLEKMLLAK